MKREWRLVALLGILAVAFPLACKKNAPTTTASVQPAKTARPAESARFDRNADSARGGAASV